MSAERRYVVRFDYPEGTLYAGRAGDSLGWAPTIETALTFDTTEAAGRMLANGYGSSAEYGYVIDAETGERV